MKHFKNSHRFPPLVFLAAMFIFFATSSGVSAQNGLTLEDCLAEAQKNSPVIAASEAEREKAVWFLKEMQSGQSLGINLCFTGSYLKADPLTASTSNFDNELTVSWPLYTGGKTQSLIGQAQLRLRSAEFGLAAAKQQVKLSTTTAYYRLLQAKDSLSLAEQSLNRVTAHLSQVKTRYQLGNAAKIDLIRVELEITTAEQDLIKSRTEYQLALTDLNSTLGRPLNEPLLLNETPSYEKMTVSLEQCLRQAEERRPELVQAELSLSIAEKDVSAIKGEYLPSVTLNGTANVNDKNFPGTNNGNWSLNLTANWNLFDSGRTASRINQANAEIARARENCRQVRESIRLEVCRAFGKLKETEDLLAACRIATVKAEEEYDIVRLSYEKGFETSLNVLTYHVALSRAKKDLQQEIWEYGIIKAQLLKTQGLL